MRSMLLSLLALLLVSVSLDSRRADAGVILSLPNLILEPDDLAGPLFLDVAIEVVGQIPELASYNVSLKIAPTAGVQLTDAVEAPSAVFPGQAPMVFGTGDILQIADFLGPGEQNPLSTGMNLVRALFQVNPPSTRGVYQISFTPEETLLVARDASEIAIDGLVGGSITIVPEPASVVLIGLGGMLALAAAVRASQLAP